VALLLKKKGITRVRPLTGGIDAWVAQQLAMESPISLSDAGFELTEAAKLRHEGD